MAKSDTKNARDQEFKGDWSVPAPPLAVAVEAPARLYWIGLVREAWGMFENLTVAGQAFQRASGLHHYDKNGNNIAQMQAGGFARWTDEEFAALPEKLNSKVLRRIHGKGGINERWTTISTTGTKDRPYQARPGDIPVGTLVYVVGPLESASEVFSRRADPGQHPQGWPSPFFKLDEAQEATQADRLRAYLAKRGEVA